MEAANSHHCEPSPAYEGGPPGDQTTVRYMISFWADIHAGSDARGGATSSAGAKPGGGAAPRDKPRLKVHLLKLGWRELDLERGL